MDSLVLFLSSVIDHWGSLMTGGIIIAIIVVVEHYLGKSLTWGIFLAVALLFFTYASYQAWDDEHTNRLKSEQELAKERQQLAGLQDAGAKKTIETKRAQAAQLQRFAFLATSIIGRQLPLTPNRILVDSEFDKYETEANKWINDTATWILENLGGKAQRQFLDISDTEPNDTGQPDSLSQQHFNVMLNLRKYRENIRRIIWDLHIENN